MLVHRAQKAGFTLVELLIVVMILGILAAVVVPRFSTNAAHAKHSALYTSRNILQKAIDLYRIQHGDTYPGTIGGSTTWANLVSHLTSTSNADGSLGGDFGPYLRTGIPRNPYNNLNTGALGDVPVGGDETKGWYYNPTTGVIQPAVPDTGGLIPEAPLPETPQL